MSPLVAMERQWKHARQFGDKMVVKMRQRPAEAAHGVARTSLEITTRTNEK